MKNELIKTDDTSPEALMKVIKTSLQFFQRYIPSACIEDLRDGTFDIIDSNGKELGSYGIRECEFLRYVYGTGCAEPRLSKLIKLQK